MAQFAVFERRFPEDIEKVINEWNAKDNKIIEQHSSFPRQDQYDKSITNIVIVVQYHMKGINGAE